MTAVSEVVVERVVRSPFAAALDHAQAFLAECAGRGAEVRVPLRDFFILRRPVRMVFARRSDERERGRPHDALDVGWTAGTHWLPEFHGTLRLRIASIEETRLTLEGTYRPPFGPLGIVFDRVLGRSIARTTIRDLLDRLSDEIERREAAFRAAHAGSSGSTG